MNCNNAGSHALAILNQDIIECGRCPRLVPHRREIANLKRRAYSDWTYWGKPVPSFGDPLARLLIVGLAPGAHGSNRTGRMFTGDRSGEFLYRSLFRAGFASRPESLRADDGLELLNAWMTASAHCAPPENKPTPDELKTCGGFFERELRLLKNVEVVVVLGKIAMNTYLGALKLRRSTFRFGHNVLYGDLQPKLLCSYHPSQQNTSTGKLTQTMLDELFLHAKELIQSEPVPAEPRR